MSPEGRITIAKACGIPIIEELGIRYKDGAESWGQSPEYTAEKCANYQRQGLGCELIKRLQTVDEFDPFNDLNDMHRAEKVLTPEQWPSYIKAIERNVNTSMFLKKLHVCYVIDYVLVHATAAQRAEAFLICIQ